MTSDSVGRVLSLECDKGDEFAYVDAERVQRGDLDSFLPFACWKGSKAFEFSYRVGSLLSLAQILSSPVDASYVQVVVGSLLHMMRECERNGLSRLRVVFDLQYVFLDSAAAALRFAYVPMRSYASPAGESDLLVQLCRRAKVPPADQPLIAAIWDYACRTTIITSVGFEAFLESWGFKVDHGSELRRRTEPFSSAPDRRSSYGWDFMDYARLRGEADRIVGDVGAGDDPLDQRVSRSKGECRRTDDFEGDADSPAVSQSAPNDGLTMRMTRTSNGATYELAEGAYEVGRSSGCAIALGDAPSVSRKHARIVVRPDGCTVIDLGSSNGVFVGGARIEPGEAASISTGDLIAFGAEEFRIV